MTYAVGDVFEDRRKPGRRIRLAERRDPPTSWSNSKGTWRADVLTHPGRSSSPHTYLSDDTLARQWVLLHTAEANRNASDHE